MVECNFTDQTKRLMFDAIKYSENEMDLKFAEIIKRLWTMPDKPTPEEMFKKEEKIEIDPCLDFSVLMLESAAELADLGKIYNRIQSPVCKKILEGFIYNGIMEILESIKGFEEQCGIHSEYYKALLEETIEEFGDLNYVHTASNADALIEVFHRNILVLCKKDNQIPRTWKWYNLGENSIAKFKEEGLEILNGMVNRDTNDLFEKLHPKGIIRRNKYMVNDVIRLSECKCISNEDKEVLLDALTVRRDSAIRASTIVRLPESIERIETRLLKVEKMMETIKNIHTC